ncbi:MAG: hypothetical protein ACMXYK_04225 [Candidatus Woesearchaeota archaeon]
MTDPMGLAILGIIIGTLAAIVYSLRILVLLERRIARMDAHIVIITKKIAKEEVRIEKTEAKILKELEKNKKKSKK